MAHYEVIQVEQEYIVAAPLLAARVIGERPYARNKDAPDFVFSGAVYHERVPLDGGYRVVVGVVVADGDDVRPLAGVAQAEALVVRVRDYRRVLALQAKRSVTQPDDFCH